MEREIFYYGKSKIEYLYLKKITKKYKRDFFFCNDINDLYKYLGSNYWFLIIFDSNMDQIYNNANLLQILKQIKTTKAYFEIDSSKPEFYYTQQINDVYRKRLNILNQEEKTIIESINNFFLKREKKLNTFNKSLEKLSNSRLEVFNFLIENCNRPVSTQEICTTLFNEDTRRRRKNLYTYISDIRSFLKDKKVHPQKLLRSQKGKYQLVSF